MLVSGLTDLSSATPQGGQSRCRVAAGVWPAAAMTAWRRSLQRVVRRRRRLVCCRLQRRERREEGAAAPVRKSHAEALTHSARLEHDALGRTDGKLGKACRTEDNANAP